jgi:hypothetical protein
MRIRKKENNGESKLVTLRLIENYKFEMEELGIKESIAQSAFRRKQRSQRRFLGLCSKYSKYCPKPWKSLGLGPMESKPRFA